MDRSQQERWAEFEQEVREGQRFEFGKNWQAFLTTLDDDRILIAENSLKEMLGVEDLAGKTFLDAGSGSGLFSLVARRLGARVHSFDFDPSSVSCAVELRDRYFSGDPEWTIEHGSVLDREYLSSLGSFDIVYSWGVLHHTGDMWSALQNVAGNVKPGGTLFIAIYNDQGFRSKFWLAVKKVYCSSVVGKGMICSVFFPYFAARAAASSLVNGENRFAGYKKDRGMSITHDWHDWLGGLPFEVASLEELRTFYEGQGFKMINHISTDSLGNNELVFCKSGDLS